MKVFIVGMPESGRTTVAKSLCQDPQFRYVDGSSWVKATFRPQKVDEHPQQYHDEYHHWFLNCLKHKPQLCANHITDSMSFYEGIEEKEFNYVIDGVVGPRDFCNLFDYNKDLIIILDRTNNNAEYKDYENIGVSVIRDYCFWLASANLLPKERWIEYKFQIPGEDSDWVKSLGSKNSVFIVRSLNSAITHLKKFLRQE
jgi:broad-specificity NMP kinase